MVKSVHAGPKPGYNCAHYYSIYRLQTAVHKLCNASANFRRGLSVI